jgi:alpha-methylacyl-CoA racemase
MMAGPLRGLRIIELAGIGPGPFCGMMLADHGADVIRVERPGGALDTRDTLARSRRSIVVDMKKPGGIQLVRDLARKADGLIEGYRPGVTERLGLGPDILLSDNPRLVYGRMTGWGQSGPYAQSAGHDINYIALSGVLHTIGAACHKPVAPVNYLGDFGGGGMMLAFAMVAALLAVRMGADGDVIDCAMTEGSALLAGMSWYMHGAGTMQDQRGVNLLDGGAPFYDTYECADGKFIAIGSIEPQFYNLWRGFMGLDNDPAFDDQMNRENWPVLKARVADIVRTRTRDEWCTLMEHTDTCFAPVLSLSEAAGHPHNVARGSFTNVGGITQPAPAPRYLRQTLDQPRVPPEAGGDADAILQEIGYDPARIAQLRQAAVLG